MQVQFSSAALSDVRRAIEYYDAESPGAGDAFLDDLEGTLTLLMTFPHVGSPAVSGTRRLVLRRFPHSVVYREASESLWVVAVEHHRQRPESWRERL